MRKISKADQALTEARLYLAHAAPDLLINLLRSCPEAASWCDENAPEIATSIINAHLDACNLETYGGPKDESVIN